MKRKKTPHPKRDGKKTQQTENPEKTIPENDPDKPLSDKEKTTDQCQN